MSGFETMSSKLNNALHPAVDPNDRYDPTFIGVTRKQRAKAPVSGFLKEERGKQIDLEKKKHGDHLVQLETQYKPETFKGDTKSTRFGAGFNRRPASLIASDVRRRSEEEKERQKKDNMLEYKREYHFQRTRSSPWNPITGEIPQALTKAASHVAKYEPPIHTGKAMSSERWRQNVDFSWSEKRQKAAENTPVTYTKRQERLMREGVTEKDWSVAQQLHCGDGYVSMCRPEALKQSEKK